MFFSDTDILVVREQHRDRLQAVAHERLIREIEQTNQQRPVQNITGWVDRLLLKPTPKHPNRLDRERAQTV